MKLLNFMAENTKQIKSDDKIWGVVAYLWILSLVALAARKNNEFVRFHANQGVLLFVVSIVTMVLGPIGMLINLLIAVAAIVGIFKALQGEKWVIPGVGGFAKKLGDNFIQPHEKLCDITTCYFADKKGALFSDATHLSKYGSMKMLPLFNKINKY